MATHRLATKERISGSGTFCIRWVFALFVRVVALSASRFREKYRQYHRNPTTIWISPLLYGQPFKVKVHEGLLCVEGKSRENGWRCSMSAAPGVQKDNRTEKTRTRTLVFIGLQGRRE